MTSRCRVTQLNLRQATAGYRERLCRIQSEAMRPYVDPFERVTHLICESSIGGDQSRIGRFSAGKVETVVDGMIDLFRD